MPLQHGHDRSESPFGSALDSLLDELRVANGASDVRTAVRVGAGRLRPPPASCSPSPI